MKYKKVFFNLLFIYRTLQLFCFAILLYCYGTNVGFSLETGSAKSVRNTIRSRQGCSNPQPKQLTKIPIDW
jgi:hypothetical protein